MDLRGRVRELLAAHRPVDDRERAFHSRMLDLLEVPGDPFRRDHFDPGHFTASAIVLAPDGREMLEVHHAKLGRWLQPGGHVEPCDRTLDLAARREVLEETGLAALDDGAPRGLPFELDIHAIPAHGAEPEHLHFDVRFLFRALSRGAGASAESRGVRWTSLDEVGARLRARLASL